MVSKKHGLVKTLSISTINVLWKTSSCEANWFTYISTPLICFCLSVCLFVCFVFLLVAKTCKKDIEQILQFVCKVFLRHPTLWQHVLNGRTPYRKNSWNLEAGSWYFSYRLENWQATRWDSCQNSSGLDSSKGFISHGFSTELNMGYDPYSAQCRSRER